MLYRYKAIDHTDGEEKNGSIDASSLDIAIASLQRRELIIISIVAADDANAWKKILSFGGAKKVPYREVVILSRQISTLFHAQVSALRVFQLLSRHTCADIRRYSGWNVSFGSAGKAPWYFF
jgi:type II secretory pathway component PulF